MPFQLKVYASKSFLLKLEELKLRTIDEFGTDIDLESYLFFETVIYRKAPPHIIVDLPQEEINSFRELSPQETLGNTNEDLIRLIQAKKDKRFYSDEGLILRLRNKEAVKKEELPHYLFLGSVSEDICIQIEKCYGIACYSLNRLKVHESIRKVCLNKLQNTRHALYQKVKESSFNSIHINDPYFFKNAFGAEKRTEVISHLLKKDREYRADFKVSITTTLKESGRTESDFNAWGSQFQTELFAQQTNSSFSFSLGKSSDGSNHDRYIFTNKHIHVIGNSLYKNDPTHHTSFPIGIYCNFFD